MDAATLAAMGEPTRFAIVELLRDGARSSVSEIAESLGINDLAIHRGSLSSDC